MSNSTLPGVPEAGYELHLTRRFEAPRALIFQAWTQKQHLVHWSAPHGFVITYCEGDLRPGGAWRTCMRAPDGTEHWLGGTYREIVPDERLVFTHIWDDENGQPGHETLVTVTLEEAGDGTQMTFQQTFLPTATARDGPTRSAGRRVSSVSAII